MAHLYNSSHGSRITLRSGKTLYVEKYDRVTDLQIETPDTPLLFIHGFSYTIKTWIPLLPHFPQYTRIVFDAEPHGRTGASGGPINTPNHAIDVNDILTYFGYGSAILIAHSAGTMIAMQFAHDFPGKAKKLVLLGPLGQPLSPEVHTGPHLVRTLPFEQILAINTSWLGKQRKDDAEILALIESELRQHYGNREDLVRYLEGFAAFEFEGVNGVETWVIKGLQDTAISADAPGSVCKLTNGTMLEVDTGHFFAWEDLSATVAALDTALKS
ncbi:hypothetical protein NM688_g7219 [Phlebia brevispora]|uniref:Uncharacterized protein n=1 Tax=Phlebia brevispora TaxID=194682 RepID=A0ACC1S808_9APHY|nr:hypothetical protein NM688_g7219 [Phlebia brevispora]